MKRLKGGLEKRSTSKKAKRVARSTLTAETLAAVEAVDYATVTKISIEEILNCSLPPIQLFVDNKSLYEVAHTTNVVSEKRLLIDLSALREKVENKELVIKCVPTKDQIADVFTKAGVDKRKLTDVISSGKLNV